MQEDDALKRFAEGSTVIRRDVLRGRIWTATPCRVVEDSGDALVCACWPGIEILAPTTWIEWLRTGDDNVRKQGIPNLASGRWDLGRWVWRDNGVLMRLSPDDCFSVLRFFPPDGVPGAWYVNFERPYRRTAIGIDTFDLLLDLVIEPDLSGWSWKDEDEYEQGRRLGLIDDAMYARIEQARQQVLALIERRDGLFGGAWSSRAPDPSWPLPLLPLDVLTIPPG